MDELDVGEQVIKLHRNLNKEFYFNTVVMVGGRTDLTSSVREGFWTYRCRVAKFLGAILTGKR